MNTQKQLYLDCFGGVAGDMILAALLDLGVPLKIIEDAVKKLPLHGYSIKVEKTKRASIEATRFIVDVDEHHQPHRHFSDIREMISESTLNAGIKVRAIRIFEILAEAEARVHGSTVDHVHFHEVGAVDSIIDIVGIAAAFEFLNVQINASVVPLGSGFIKTAHGTLPVPAPATLFILKGVPVEGTEIKTELTTPTGAAVLKASVETFGPYPSLIIEKTGFGAGTRTHETRPGLLRAVLGVPDESVCRSEKETIVIESNIDDMTAELAAHVKTKLLEAGALDVWLENIQMKKDRPALKISILCPISELERLAGILFTESSTIGLRYYSVGRIEMSREMKTVKTPYGEVRVKIGRGLGAVNVAPEFEDCRLLAEKSGVPLKQIMASACALSQKLIEE